VARSAERSSYGKPQDVAGVGRATARPGLGPQARRAIRKPCGGTRGAHAACRAGTPTTPPADRALGQTDILPGADCGGKPLARLQLREGSWAPGGLPPGVSPPAPPPTDAADRPRRLDQRRRPRIAASRMTLSMGRDADASP